MPRPEPTSARERQQRSAARAPGDEAAPARSATWIQDHLDAVYRYARRRLSVADAEDVVQQSFEALLRAEAEGRTPTDAGAYLLGTARRRVADVFRRRARPAEPVALPAGWEGYAQTVLPDAALETEELRELVHTALGLLRGSDAALLRERYRRGVPVAEIAHRRGITTKAAELRLRRARAAFAARFREIGRDWVKGADDRPSDDVGRAT
jgi:RNA polymerase sigma factor (sigma-70 family)